MTIDSPVAAPQGCIATIRADLVDWESQLRGTLAAPDTVDNVLGRTTTILANVAHLFVYLEGNRKFLDYASLLPWRDALLENRAFLQAVLDLLSGLVYRDPRDEELRESWTRRLGEIVDGADADLERTERDLLASAEQVVELVAVDRAELLARLGIASGAASPEATFFRVISTTGSAQTRRKLARAWDRQQERRSDELAGLVDRIVGVRRSRARQHGYGTPLRETLGRCHISEDEAEDFLSAYLTEALRAHERLGAAIQSATGCTDDPMVHFPHYLRRISAGTELRLLPVRGCLDLACAVIERLFGYVVRPEDAAGPHVIALSVHSGDRRIGTIQVDMVGVSTDTTPTIRQDPSATGEVLPVGHLLCRYRTGRDGERLVSFDSAHSMFHEFGHALTHVAIHPPRPGLSGLEYLPVERQEDLSLWFEKWVYHPDFTARVAPSVEAAQGLDMCRRVKMLEFLNTQLQRSVVAALDFDVHRRADGGIWESFRRLDDRFGIARYCDLGDLLWTFTWPMYRANPGASLVYLWGAAYGAQQFSPFLSQRLADLSSSAEVTDAFASCFDPDLPSERPDVGAVLRCYEPGITGAAIR